ncbi:MAG: ABC transporter permease [Anaerolineae bacterium]|jgi:ABC-2 type transport system permease protein|nr:ABC transporter permease [Anaerolineae bacterium]
MLSRILNIARKDLLHLWHNRLLLVMVIFGAACELLLVGLATGAEVDDLKMAVLDHDDSLTSQQLIDALDATSTLNLDDDAVDVFDEHNSRDAALDDMFTGGFFGSDPVLLVEIPDGFEDSLKAGKQPTIKLTVNGASSVSAREARRAAEDVIYTFGAVQTSERLAAELGLPAPTAAQVKQELDAVQPDITVRFNEELDRAAYTTPSEAAFVLYIIALMVAAFMLAREREYGTFEQLLVMPMRPIEIILGKAVPAMLIGYANFILVLILMNVVFDIAVRGSLLLLLILAMGYLFVELGRGFLVAMVSRTQNQALLIIMLMAFIDITFSGYAVPVESMPDIMQVLSNFFPIRHWMIILRGILQKDVGLGVLWPQLAWLTALGLVINAATLWFFRRTLGEQR